MIVNNRWMAAAVALTISATAGGQVQFEDVAPARGIQPYSAQLGKGAGVAAADFDDDGDPDLFVPTAPGVPHQLYRNLGDGHFEEIAAAVGLDLLAGHRAALWLDYDGDRRLDLFLAGDCWNATPDCPEVSTIALYRQAPDGAFVDVTLDAGLGDDLVESIDPHRGGAAAGDVNDDGWLDLVTGLWSGHARLFLNDGDGTFTETSASSGVGVPSGYYWQPMLHDFDGDGWLDVYYAEDFQGNRLWLNQRDGTFSDVAADAGAASAWNDMGLALGDYDNDGDFDVYISNITNALRHNVLYRNDSTVEALSFLDVSVDLGVAEAGWGWGVAFLDADRDGWLDIAATNGWFGGDAGEDPSKLFLNLGPAGGFADVSDDVGFNDTLWGSTVLAVDLDGDGDEDLVQTCNGSGVTAPALRLLENEPGPEAAGHHWLAVRPRMVGPNHRAIGAVIRARTGTVTRSRLVTAGTSFLGQVPAEGFFGLGESELVDELTVEWPGGGVSVLENVAADQVLTVSRPDLDGDGVVNGADLGLVLANWGPCPDGAGGCPGDADGDGEVDVDDLIIVILGWG